MLDKKVTSVGFGIGMMVFMTMSALSDDDPITAQVIIAILVVGVLCGFVWFIVFDKIIKHKK